MNVAIADVRRETGRGIMTVARIGYAAHGLVYCVVGVLALMAVFGESGGSYTDSQGALRRLGEQPFGAWLLGTTALGLACYALWNAVRALLDPEHRGHAGKGLALRFGYAVSALIHGLLSLYAGRRALGSGAAGKSSRSLTAEVLTMPLGRVSIGIVGLIVVGFGLYQIYKAYVAKVRPEISVRAADGRQRRWARNVGRLGTLARGLVFPIIGASLITAALEQDPRETRGFGQALQDLAHIPLGDALVAFVAVGLFAYGGYMFFAARYAEIPRPL